MQGERASIPRVAVFANPGRKNQMSNLAAAGSWQRLQQAPPSLPSPHARAFVKAAQRAYDQTAVPPPEQLPQFGVDPLFGDYHQMYAATFDDGYDIPAVPIEEIDPKYYRQVVPDPTGEQPGTVVVDTSNHFLYLVGNNGGCDPLRRWPRPRGL